MDFVKPSIAFPIGYVDPGQDPGLIVGAEIYDVSTGTASLLSTQTLTADTLGAYLGSFAGVNLKTYMVITLVFTDIGLTTPDTRYAPQTQLVQINSGNATFFVFDYTAYDHAPGLDVRARLLDLTTGSPVLASTPTMVHVAHGAYIGSFTGTLGKSYGTRSIPYLTGSPDPTRAATSDVFQSAVSAYTSLDPSVVVAPTGYVSNGVSKTGTGSGGGVVNVIEEMTIELNPDQLIMELE